MSATIIYRQLYLFDCDGGRSSLFNDNTKLSGLPNNCELYLFWNSNDLVIANNLNELKTNPQIHLCPSHTVNCKNSANEKLIYFLGKLVNQFSKIIIVQGNDKIYEEVVEAVKDGFPMNKIELHAVKESHSSEFEILLGKMRDQNTKEHYIEDDYERIHGNLQLKSSLITLHLSNNCSECGKSFPNIIGVMNHLMAKHQLMSNSIKYIKVADDATYLSTAVMKQSNVPLKSAKSFFCSNSKCASKKKKFAREEDLERHNESMHK